MISLNALRRRKMKRAMLLALALALPCVLVAQSQQSTGTVPTKSTRRRAAAKTDAVAAQLGELKQAIDAQQQQIKQLSDQLQSRDQQIQQLQQRIDQSQTATTQAESKAEAAQSQASAQAQTVDSLKTDVADLKSNSTNAAVALQETQKNIAKQFETPNAIHYKGITITPGGFAAAETVTRQRADSSDINTSFGGIPYPGNSLAKVWENNFTGRQSRLSLLAEGKYGATKLTGYYEADWLGTGVTSNNRQSNSYVLRQRQIWGQAKMDNGFSFSGGQMWSLVTEDRKGIDNRQEIQPLTIDPQYQVGYSWARQYGARVVKDFGGKFAVALAAEGPQATIGGRGFSTLVTDNLAAATVNTVTNTFIDAPGAGAGLFNFVDTTGYSINKSPDGIVKVAADPGWGHYEVYGVVSPFRNRVFPCGVVGTNQKDTTATGVPPALKQIACPVDGTVVSSAAGAYNDTRVGGGVGVNFRLPVVPKVLDFEVQGLAGDGIGRYGSAQLADLTFRPNGTEALIRSAHGMTGFEYHSNRLDAYVYGGEEYGARTAYTGYDSITVVKTPANPATTTTPAVPATTTTTIKTTGIGGYGSPFANNSGCLTEAAPNNTAGATTVGGLNPVTTPSSGGSCAGDIRVIQEGTLGFWYKFFQGPKGGLRWGIQYSYFMKDGWSGNNGSKTAAGFAPKAVDNMVWTSFRYYIP
jgi:hypothetical protein